MRMIVLAFILLAWDELSTDPAATSMHVAAGSKMAIDMDGNGKNDRIVEVRHEKEILRPKPGRGCQLGPGIFLRYLLHRDSRAPEELLDYFIGTQEATYWVHEIRKAEDVDRDGSLDLIFYAGDDTTEEYVFILQRPSHFEAVYTGPFTDEYSLNEAKDIVVGALEGNPKVVARWNSVASRFEGSQVAWISGECVGLRAGPGVESKILRRLFQGDIVQLMKPRDGSNWQKVKIGEDEGYVSSLYLSSSSPRRRFGDKDRG